jgi:hypothetical protein
MPTEATGTVTLYHGTDDVSGESLIENGWEPNAWSAGGNCGQTRCLYLTSEPENALWFAEEKGFSTVLAVELAVADLIVDPEDGIGESVAEEIEIAERNGLPYNLAAVRPIPAGAFRLHEPHPAPSA